MRILWAMLLLEFIIPWRRMVYQRLGLKPPLIVTKADGVTCWFGRYGQCTYPTCGCGRLKNCGVP